MPSPGITKKALADAMKALMHEEPLSKISVGDIVGRCGLNRNSFYYHFKDKYDLVNWIFYTELVQEFAKGGSLGSGSWALIERLCAFFYRDKAFYINALSVTGQNSFVEYYMDLLRTLVLTHVPELFLDDEDQEFCATFFVDALSAATFRWLSEGAVIPPAKLAALVKKAATGAALQILSANQE